MIGRTNHVAGAGRGVLNSVGIPVMGNGNRKIGPHSSPVGVLHSKDLPAMLGELEPVAVA